MARPKGTWTPEIVRRRLKIAAVARRVAMHALGQVKMSATEVKAAEIVLRKGLPDLKSVEHSGEVTHLHGLSDAELDARIAELAAQAGIAGAAGGATQTH